MGDPCAGQVNANGSVANDSTACSLTLSESLGLAVPIGSGRVFRSKSNLTSQTLGCDDDALILDKSQEVST